MSSLGLTYAESWACSIQDSISCLKKILVRASSREETCKTRVHRAGLGLKNIGLRRAECLIVSLQWQMRSIVMVEKVETKSKAKQKAKPEQEVERRVVTK